MLIDTHCHLDFPQYTSSGDEEELSLASVLKEMQENQVSAAICISVNMEDWHNVHDLALSHPNLYCTVGVHPDYEDAREPEIEELVELSAREKVVAIGECGLDYHHCPDKPKWQEDRFCRHIQAARLAKKPIIVHSRDSGKRMMEMLRAEKAYDCMGIMHCFTDTWDIARAALDMGFMISFSGIVTFKNARELHEVARKVPRDLFVIETDSPFLAPHPHRGKTNQPAYVRHVAQSLAELRDTSLAEIATQSSGNASRLMGVEFPSLPSI